MTSSPQQVSSPQIDRHQLDRTLRLIVLGATAIIAMLVLLTIVLLFSDYRNRVSSAEMDIEQALMIYHEQTRLIYNDMDRVLRGTREYLLTAPNASPENLHSFLTQITIDQPALRTLLVIDADGLIIADSRPDEAAVGADVRDRDYYTAHLDTTSDFLYVSEPVQSRLDGAWSLPLTRSVRDVDGDLVAVVATSIEPQYFTDRFPLVQDHHVKAGALLRDDGLVLATFPDDMDLTGQILPERASLFDADHATVTTFQGDVLGQSSEEYLVAYRYVPPLPLTLVFQLSMNDVLADFYWQATLISVFVALVCLGIVLFARRQLQQTRMLAAQATALQTTNSSLNDEIKERTQQEAALQQTTERLNLLLENMPVALYTCNLEQGKGMNYISAGVEVLTGYAPHQFIERSFWLERIHPEDRPRIQGNLGDYEQDDYTNEYRWRVAAGQYRWFRDKLKVIRDGDEITGIGIWYDIHDLQQMAAARQTAEMLRVELDREQEMRALRSTFVSMITHELRNPLAAIQFTVSSLQRYRDRLTPERIEEKYNSVHQQIRQMNDLVEDILTLGKLEQGMMSIQVEEQDLHEFCQEIAADFREIHGDSHKIMFESELEPLILEFDDKLMRQALNNLLGNAVKYSPSGSSVILALHQQNGSAVIQVKDEGIGIPEAAQQRLFETFYRADNVGNLPGTGLGLAITRHVVELSGGSIDVDSELGSGSTFTIALPVD